MSTPLQPSTYTYVRTCIWMYIGWASLTTNKFILSCPNLNPPPPPPHRVHPPLWKSWPKWKNACLTFTQNIMRSFKIPPCRFKSTPKLANRVWISLSTHAGLMNTVKKCSRGTLDFLSQWRSKALHLAGGHPAVLHFVFQRMGNSIIHWLLVLGFLIHDDEDLYNLEYN